MNYIDYQPRTGVLPSSPVVLRQLAASLLLEVCDESHSHDQPASRQGERVVDLSAGPTGGAERGEPVSTSSLRSVEPCVELFDSGDHRGQHLAGLLDARGEAMGIARFQASIGNIKRLGEIICDSAHGQTLTNRRDEQRR